MKIKELLPIGSVVMLKEGKKRLMIYGIRQTDQETNIEYDYIAVLYPEGCLGQVGHYFFNHEDIEQVYYFGLNDLERQTFLNKLEEFYNKNENK